MCGFRLPFDSSRILGRISFTRTLIGCVMGRFPANLNRYFGRAAEPRPLMMPNSGNAMPAARTCRRVTADARASSTRRGMR